jgi:ATP-dependent DNA helicase RecG
LRFSRQGKKKTHRLPTTLWGAADSNHRRSSGVRSGQNRPSCGHPHTNPQAPVSFEIPRPVILEAIVNAVAHRDYRSSGFVQVIVFADRLELWNPGELPPGLTPELFRKPHGPMPRNPLIAEPLYRVKYVEKAGTGTTDMIAECRKAGLPEPDFEQRGAYFVVTVWRDWLTDEVLNALKLTDRQKAAVTLVKVKKQITSGEYRAHTGVEARTATRDLNGLVKKGVFSRHGDTRGA